MSATKKSIHIAAVFNTFATVVAASVALGYALAPAIAVADEANISQPVARTGFPDQMAGGVPRMILPASIDQSVIGGNVMSGASGAMAVNQAAGDMNQQANAAAIAYNPQGSANVQTGAFQGSRNIRGSLPDIASTRIDGKAFAGTSGVLMVNQASGFANSQANSTAIAMGIKGEVIADSVLAETFPDAAGLVKAGHGQTGMRDVSVSETAFQNAQGVVQLNQTAGSGNNSANNFALRLSVEAKQ